jgi:hypothetical protein
MLPLESTDHVQPVELAPFCHAAHLVHDLSVIPVEEPNVVIPQIGNGESLPTMLRNVLNRLGAKRDSPTRALVRCFAFYIAIYSNLSSDSPAY